MMKTMNTEAEFHIEPMSSFNENELNECSFALVDFSSSEVYVFPTKFLYAIMNKLNEQTIQQNALSQNVLAPSSTQ